jgi:hypothetical protein
LFSLIRIDPKEPVSDIIWDTAETLVHRATLMENKAESERLLRAPSQHKSLHRLKSMEGGLRNKNPIQLTQISVPAADVNIKKVTLKEVKKEWERFSARNLCSLGGK